MNEKQSSKISIQELQDMCENSPTNVSIAKGSALDRAAKEFGLMTANDIKKFIVDGLEELTFHNHSESERFPGTIITSYKFMSGRKYGYLAFHQSAGNPNGIHIKSLHLDDTSPSLGTLGDLFKDALLGSKK